MKKINQLYLYVSSRARDYVGIFPIQLITINNLT